MRFRTPPRLTSSARDEYNASPVNNPSQEALDHCEVFKYLGDDTKLYDQVWTEIISEF